jgi:hypothetical protein
MIDPTGLQVQYGEYQRQMAWVNSEGWKFESPARAHRIRRAVAALLVRLAALITPPNRAHSA